MLMLDVILLIRQTMLNRNITGDRWENTLFNFAVAEFRAQYISEEGYPPTLCMVLRSLGARSVYDEIRVVEKS